MGSLHQNIRAQQQLLPQGQPVRLGLLSVGQIKAALGVIKQSRTQALIVPGDGLFFSQARRIAELAVQQHLPTLFSTREPVQVGGLMSYGPNLAEQFYRAATYVDKMLRGAHPGDLPVEQPTTFELVINQLRREMRAGHRRLQS